jgi:hypothetical protein
MLSSFTKQQPSKSDYELLKSLGFQDSNKSIKKAKQFTAQLLLSHQQRLEPQTLEPLTST